jgi:predicted PurR-regulated permease PerM
MVTGLIITIVVLCYLLVFMYWKGYKAIRRIRRDRNHWRYKFKHQSNIKK